MLVSLKNVAERAGVSGATISRVLNGKDDRIPKETRERIIRIANEMGYRSNRFLRSSRDGKTRTIGLMISGMLNPFFVSVMEAAEISALKLGYQVVLDPGQTVRGSYYEHGKLQDWPVDGIVMWAREHQTIQQALGTSALQVPAVYIGHQRVDDENFVGLDLGDGTSQLVNHLAERGYRSLSYVAPYDFRGRSQPEPRVNAYFQACSRHGIDAQYFLLEPQEETFTVGLNAGLRIAALAARERPQALVCHNDVIAIGIYNGLRRAGLRIPEDIAIVGYDAIEQGQCQDIPLTTIQAPIDEMCALALKVITNHLQDNTTKLQQILLPVTLVVGGTS